LRASSGPLAKHFRSLVPDPDGLDRLDSAKLAAHWEAELNRYAAHYKFDEKTREEAKKALEQTGSKARAEFLNPEFADKIIKYKEDLSRIDRVLNSKSALKYERERAYKDRRELEGARRELLAKVNEWTTGLHQAWTPKSDAARVGPPPPLRTQLDWINITTMGGMLVVGVCLILGLFTRLAALGAAAYLLLFYLSMPPWPGVPPPPQVEGHYLFVNKNLIELLACLVLASTPTGLWIGLDAILFGARARRRAALAEPGSSASDDGPNGSIPERSRTNRPAPARPAKHR
jgi:uncharacterized membrane protein YphA (DoxX/SURF4 family)